MSLCIYKLPGRVRINQPSSKDPHPELHWKVGIGIPEPNMPGTIRVFFTEGPIVSMQISSLYLHNC